MTFRQWRQRLRCMHALRFLALGESVTAAGLAVGYESASAFIAMFRGELGLTPSRYYVRGSAASASRNSSNRA
jgi:AraC-like DNA-binding protein